MWSCADRLDAARILLRPTVPGDWECSGRSTTPLSALNIVLTAAMPTARTAAVHVPNASRLANALRATDSSPIGPMSITHLVLLASTS